MITIEDLGKITDWRCPKCKSREVEVKQNSEALYLLCGNCPNFVIFNKVAKA